LGVRFIKPRHLFGVFKTSSLSEYFSKVAELFTHLQYIVDLGN